jgi:hypothetical protein
MLHKNTAEEVKKVIFLAIAMYVFFAIINDTGFLLILTVTALLHTLSI